MTDRHADRRADTASRFVAAAIGLGCLGVLFVAAGLNAAPEGHGTHTQLGLPACGWAATLGAPCPTCGMTTSFTTFADAGPIEAFLTQPFGAILAVLCSATFWACAWAVLTGDRIGAIYLRLVRPPLLWAAGAGAAAGWVYKLFTWE